MPKTGLLERLAKRPVIGDGSMSVTLEKRGYCRAGPWTPEAVLLYPDAVRQLLREYLRSGADVLQTPCFYCSDGKLKHGKAEEFKAYDINTAACKIAKEIASEGDALVCGGISPVMTYVKDEASARREFNKQLDVYIEHDVDFLLAEFFAYVKELEICIDVMKKAKKPICATMRIGVLGDFDGISAGECAVRMARAGADVIGVNCTYDIDTVIKTMKLMKAALDKEGLSPYLMCQPVGWRCPEVENQRYGLALLPEYPLAMDSRQCTRYEVHKFTREAYELGVRYIGGCCGMEPHHIRAMAQELASEREITPPVNDMCPPLAFLHYSPSIAISSRSSKEYWENLKCASGRPYNPPCVDMPVCENPYINL